MDDTQLSSNGRVPAPDEGMPPDPQTTSGDKPSNVTGGEHVAAQALREERARQRDTGVQRPLSDPDLFQLIDRINTLITGQEAEAAERERLMRNFERIAKRQKQYEERMKRIEDNMRQISERARAEGQAEAAESAQEAFAHARARTQKQKRSTREQILGAEKVSMYVPETRVIGINGARFKVTGGGVRDVPRPIAEELAHSQRASAMLEEQKKILHADTIDEANRVDARLRQVSEKYGARPIDESDMQVLEVID